MSDLRLCPWVQVSTLVCDGAGAEAEAEALVVALAGAMVPVAETSGTVALGEAETAGQPAWEARRRRRWWGLTNEVERRACALRAGATARLSGICSPLVEARTCS